MQSSTFLVNILTTNCYNSEDGTYDLGFKVNNKTILVRGVKIENDEVVDDWYWTDERIERAIKNANDEQIEIWVA